ncbi:hypothetical protein R4Z10_19650 [Niallia sp. XMNu-256]|uniref:hypothetical protein n=1 Tax=Niallia sp. XMNu-256 TaxID=3082444 RepID=UPI0030CFDE2F
MREIGSEFWLDQEFEELTDFEYPQWLNIGVDNKLLLSGRTAIHFVLKDILKNNKINTVYFPSYCCKSMIQPFVDFGINIIFYDVKFEEELKFNINMNQECDIFFAMNYFGFSKGRMDRYIEIFKQRNIIVIEDSTHSFLSDKSFNVHSDYIVASLRKWFPVISGGLAVKTNGRFDIKSKEETFEEMVRVRKLAMLEKASYMNGDNSNEKAEFLKKYSIANEILNKEYSLYSIDRDSYKILQNINLESVINKRKENAKIIYENLLRNDRFDFIFPELLSGDCPIFIPIIFSNTEERNKIRKHLINNSIYCPVHWPKPTNLKGEVVTDFFDNELSLVIDQRYDETDIQYLIRRLGEFYE